MGLTKVAHQRIAEHFIDKPKKLAVDATLGNGYDCEFLIRCGFEQVIAFDVQERALNISEHHLQTNGLSRYKLILDGHENLGQHINQEIDCIMFNLGYLPNGEKEITTHQQSTLCGLEAAKKKLSPTGLISVLCYPGHSQGKAETQAVGNWVEQLSKPFQFEKIDSRFPSERSPILYLLRSN